MLVSPIIIGTGDEVNGRISICPCVNLSDTRNVQDAESGCQHTVCTNGGRSVLLVITVLAGTIER